MKMIHICQYCVEPFVRPHARRMPSYCSHNCSNNAARKRDKANDAYKRAQALRRAKRTELSNGCVAEHN